MDADKKKTPVTPRPAATVLLLRDGADGLEVFMVVRHEQIDFATGALVFPGGSVDPGDRDPRLAGRVTGADGLDAAAVAFRLAAIREAFEECGVLLARRRGGAGFVDGATSERLGLAWRTRLEAGEAGLADLAEAEDLVFPVDAMVHFAHWITPPHMPKRFDTHFFLCAAPPDQVAAHDGHESVDSVWVRPADACADADAGRRIVIFPTRVNVEKLGRSRSVAEAVAAARAKPIVTVLPQVTRTEHGRIMRIPAEADYGFSEVHLEGMSGNARRIGQG